MHVHLETPRLVLRRFTTDDVDLVMALDNDPAVMRYVNGGLPVPREEVVETLVDWWLAYYERGDRYGFWAVEERATGDFLGWFHFRPGEHDGEDEPEIGYRMHTRAWGKGYATEVARALIDLGFREQGVQRVRAETMVVNVASRRVMEKAGMRETRVFHADWPVRIDGDEHGDVEYAITRDEWLAQQPDPPSHP